MWLNSYKGRINAEGGTVSKSVNNSTKRITREQILNSPSRVDVKLNDVTNVTYPCVVNDVDTFKKRRFLFLPDTIINIGDQIVHDGFTYLATNRVTDTKFPQLIGELCNEIFTIIVAGNKSSSGTDDFGRPIQYTTNDKTYNLPCVLITKDNTTDSIDNSPIPLPEGNMIIKVKYYPNIVPKINYEFKYRNTTYKVTDIIYDNVISDKGFVEIKLVKL